ncbi:hypothetical protein [Microbulbifer spongiae]|nr:hypothetical protein [Microbulbifer sp. MI-G]
MMRFSRSESLPELCEILILVEGVLRGLSDKEEKNANWNARWLLE